MSDCVLLSVAVRYQDGAQRGRRTRFLQLTESHARRKLRVRIRVFRRPAPFVAPIDTRTWIPQKNTDESAILACSAPHRTVKRRLVEIIDWSAAQSALSDRGIVLSLNHCLYRNMDAHRYLVFSGVDQLVVPRHQSTWRAFMENITATNYSKLVGACSFAAFRYYDESAGRRPTSSRRSPRGSNASYQLPRIVTHRVRDRIPSRVTGYNGFIVVPPKVISVAVTLVSRMIHGYRCVSVSPILSSVHQFESRTRLKAKDLQARVVVDSSQDKYVSRLLKMMHQRFYGKYELNLVHTIARAWNKY